MSQFWKIVVQGVVAVLVFDTVAAFASLGLKFSYMYASIGSFLIYAIIGYFAFRHCSFVRAIGAAVLVELVDATLGWYISWQIGPGALPADQVSISIIATTMAFVFIFAAVCAAIGSAVARLVPGYREGKEN